MSPTLTPPAALGARVARGLAAVPVLFALLYATCPQGGGFSFTMQVGGLHLAGSTCR